MILFRRVELRKAKVRVGRSELVLALQQYVAAFEAEVPRKPGCLAEVSDPRAIAILDAYLSGDEEFELESLAVRAGQSSDVGREMRRHDLADFFAGTGDVRPVPGSPTLRESQLHTRTT